MEGEETGCHWKYCRARRLLAESAKNDDAGFREAVQLACGNREDASRLARDFAASRIPPRKGRSAGGSCRSLQEGVEGQSTENAGVRATVAAVVSNGPISRNWMATYRESRDQIVASPTLAPLAI